MARKLRPDEERAFTADGPSLDPFLETELLREFDCLDDAFGDECLGQRADTPSSSPGRRLGEDPKKSE
jgi:hypothetical protein